MTKTFDMSMLSGRLGGLLPDKFHKSAYGVIIFDCYENDMLARLERDFGKTKLIPSKHAIPSILQEPNRELI